MKKRYWIGGLIFATLVITYIAGPKLPEPVYDPALPRVPTSLDGIARDIAERESKKPVRPGNEAHIRFAGPAGQKTEYAVVYLHGFGGSFQDGYPLNYRLADSLGANIYVARWGAHGLMPPNSMVGFTPQSAWEEAKEALAIGKRLGNKVILLSTSTGGTLAIKLAAEYPDDVYALINLSPNAKDDMPGTWVLNTPWGAEIASLIGWGDGMREVKHEEPEADKYFDTLFVASALVDLQVLVATTMTEETFNKVNCPVLTLYYYKNKLEEDERVEVDVYDEMHAAFSTKEEFNVLKPLGTPETHFLGSAIKSKDHDTPLQEAINFIDTLN